MARDPGRRHAASSPTRETHDEWRRKAGPLWLVGPLVLAWTLTVAPMPVRGQTVAGCLLSGPEEYWPDMWLDTGAAKLYIADWTNARILIHDSRSLSRLGEISLTSYLPDRPYQLAGHQAAGTLYAIVCHGTCDSQSRVIAIDTHTLTSRSLAGLTSRRSILVDDQGRRLLASGYSPVYPISHETLSVVDVDTDAIVATIDLTDLVSNGGHVGMAQELNPVTGEVLFYQGGCSQTSVFAIVNARTLHSERIIAPNACGWWIEPDGATWNWLENKLYITTQTWQGYFIYDRDTGQSSVTSCWNDGTGLFFSPATNRVYSGAEINQETTVIEGASDSCQEVDGLWGPVVGFVEAKRRAYFVGFGVTVLDENSLSIVGHLPSCIPPPDVHRPFGDQGVAVDQANGRVFARIWEGDDDILYGNPGPELDYASVLVIDDTWPKRPVRRHVRTSVP